MIRIGVLRARVACGAAFTVPLSPLGHEETTTGAQLPTVVGVRHPSVDDRRHAEVTVHQDAVALVVREVVAGEQRLPEIERLGMSSRLVQPAQELLRTSLASVDAELEVQMWGAGAACVA